MSDKSAAMFFRRLVLAAASILAGLICLLGLVPQVSAQPFGRTVVVPVGWQGTEQALPVADVLESALLERHVMLVSLHDARDRFVRQSRPPRAIGDSDLDVLTREAREAVEHVAFGRSAAAQRSVREVLQRAEHALESLNRETVHARRLLDACLSLVRNELRENRRDEALDQATRCRQLVPDLAPSEAAHPANVVGVLTEADDRLRRMRIGKLSVQAKPPAHCSVYVNGRHLGTTPFVLDSAPVGEYRVQVECGATLGRVHLVQLGEEPVELVVDAAFDRIVLSEPRLALQYSTEPEFLELALEHASQLGQQIGVDDVVLMRTRRPEVELLRVRVSQRRILGRATVAWHPLRGADRSHLQQALETLAAARIDGDSPVPSSAAISTPRSRSEELPVVDTQTAARATTQSQPASSVVERTPESKSSPPPDSSDVTSSLRRGAGYALLVPALGLYALGLGFEGRRWKLDNELYYTAPRGADLVGMNDRYDRAAAWRWLGLGGGGLGALAAALLVEPRATTPWWSYAVGAAGLGLIGAGVYELATAGKCESGGEDCELRKNSQGLGALLIAAGVPLLVVPITHVVRRSHPNEASLRVVPVAGGTAVMLRMLY